MPTERNFGFTVGGILLAIACLRTYWHAEPQHHLHRSGRHCARTFRILRRGSHAGLRWPNILWSKLGDLLFVVMNPMVMFAVYVTTFVPIGMYLRLTGKDPLFARDSTPRTPTGTLGPRKPARPPT